MTAKDVRNLITTLVILAAGVYVISMYTKSVTSGSALPSITSNLPAAVQSLSNLLIIGIAILIVILIPVYLSKRSEEKKKIQ